MNIAIFPPNWIGDAVMATSAIRAVRQHFPDANIVGVLKPYIAGVFEGSPWLDGMIPLGSWAATCLALRKRHVDLAILFPNSFRSALVARMGGCKRRVGYARGGRGWLLTDRLAPLLEGREFKISPVIDAYNLLAQHVGCPDPGYRMELFTSSTDEAAAEQVWQSTGLSKASEIICLNPGAAFGAAKFWPVDSFVQLARYLIDQRGCGVLVLCGPNERDLANQIAERTGRKSVHSLACFPLSLGLTKACIRRADLLVTTDSGPRHFAAAFDRPVVTLFGPTHIGWTETYFAKAIHLQKKVPCGPCQKRVCPLDHRCMKELTPGEVFAAATQLLERWPKRKAS